MMIHEKSVREDKQTFFFSESIIYIKTIVYEFKGHLRTISFQVDKKQYDIWLKKQKFEEDLIK